MTLSLCAKGSDSRHGADAFPSLAFWRKEKQGAEKGSYQKYEAHGGIIYAP